MGTLLDSKGGAGPLSIDAVGLDRIYQRTGCDMRTVEGRRICASNKVLMLDVMFAAWLPFCKQHGITRPAFHRMDMEFLGRLAHVFVNELANSIERDGDRETAEEFRHLLANPPKAVDPALLEQYDRRAVELNAINSERAIDEKLAELHQLLGATQGRGES